MAVPGFTDALPRGSSSERRGDRELQLSLVGYERTGGAASFLGAKVGQMREPLILPPPKLPKPLSDHTATIWNGLIYIAGGCDSPYVFDQRTFTYTCSSVSESFFVFDPSQYIDHFSSLENLPRPRYRHTSVILDNQIWLVGGRNVDGGLVEFVDVSSAVLFSVLGTMAKLANSLVYFV